ncbi:hypothetical protein WJX73_009225 [Symbiochloris irregularis]|uniref:F-box domain-containing protein n=1 Tax=Symbiochloris irregularis TaxID=706552 RepID=A0AAW1NXW9_9CHLO
MDPSQVQTVLFRDRLAQPSFEDVCPGTGVYSQCSDGGAPAQVPKQEWSQPQSMSAGSQLRQRPVRVAGVQSKAAVATIADIPPDLWIDIFVHLDTETKFHAQRACRLWFGILSNSLFASATALPGQQRLPDSPQLRYADKTMWGHTAINFYNMARRANCRREVNNPKSQMDRLTNIAKWVKRRASSISLLDIVVTQDGSPTARYGPDVIAMPMYNRFLSVLEALLGDSPMDVTLRMKGHSLHAPLFSSPATARALGRHVASDLGALRLLTRLALSRSNEDTLACLTHLPALSHLDISQSEFLRLPAAGLGHLSTLTHLSLRDVAVIGPLHALADLHRLLELRLDDVEHLNLIQTERHKWNLDSLMHLVDAGCNDNAARGGRPPEVLLTYDMLSHFQQSADKAEELLVLAEFEAAAKAAQALLHVTTYTLNSTAVRQRACHVLVQALDELDRFQQALPLLEDHLGPLSSWPTSLVLSWSALALEAGQADTVVAKLSQCIQEKVQGHQEEDLLKLCQALAQEVMPQSGLQPQARSAQSLAARSLEAQVTSGSEAWSYGQAAAATGFAAVTLYAAYAERKAIRRLAGKVASQISGGVLDLVGAGFNFNPNPVARRHAGPWR